MQKETEHQIAAHSVEGDDYTQAGIFRDHLHHLRECLFGEVSEGKVI